MRRGCNLRQLQPSGQHGWSRLPQPSSHPSGYCIAVVHLSSQLANIDTSLTQVHSSHQGSLSVIQPVSSNEFTAARIHHYNVTRNSFAALRIPRVPFIHVSIISLFFRMPYIRIIQPFQMSHACKFPPHILGACQLISFKHCIIFQCLAIP